MRTKRAYGWAATFMLLAVVGWSGCSSKNSNPTSPGGGGGGGAFDSGTLVAPATFRHTFPTAGTFHYQCNFHVSLGMVGTVTVAAGAADSTVAVNAAGTSFTPSSVTIRPGGVVTWNVTSGTHTVTSQ